MNVRTLLGSYFLLAASALSAAEPAEKPLTAQELAAQRAQATYQIEPEAARHDTLSLNELLKLPDRPAYDGLMRRVSEKKLLGQKLSEVEQQRLRSVRRSSRAQCA